LGSTSADSLPGRPAAGSLANGAAKSLATEDGRQGGVAAGCRVSDLLRADLSFNYMVNDLTWVGYFADNSAPSRFDADTKAYVVMANAYVHAKGLAPEAFGKADPYVGVGVGQTRNRLLNASERAATADQFRSNLADGTNTDVAYRLGVGVDLPLVSTVSVSLAVDHYWLGEFKSGETRMLPNGDYSAIGPWSVDKLRTVNASLGLRYQF